MYNFSGPVSCLLIVRFWFWRCNLVIPNYTSLRSNMKAKLNNKNEKMGERALELYFICKNLKLLEGTQVFVSLPFLSLYLLIMVWRVNFITWCPCLHMRLFFKYKILHYQWRIIGKNIDIKCLRIEYIPI